MNKGHLLGAFADLFKGVENSSLICLEPSPHLGKGSYLSMVNKSINVKVVRSIFKPSLFSPSSIDLFLSSHVIEHMSDPCGFVSQLYDIMKPGGMVFTEVPNHMEANVANTPPGKLHLFFPSSEAMHLLFARAGFRFLAMETMFCCDYKPLPSDIAKGIRMVFVKPGFVRNDYPMQLHRGGRGAGGA